MFANWIKKRSDRKQAELLAKRIPTILARFGELIERHPASYMDEKWLPLDKQSMKTVLKIAIATERDPQRIEWLRAGWVLLSQFQPDIGEAPVSLPQGANSPSDLLTPEGLVAIERYAKATRLAAEESERNLREVQTYMATLPERRVTPQP